MSSYCSTRKVLNKNDFKRKMVRCTAAGCENEEKQNTHPLLRKHWNGALQVALERQLLHQTKMQTKIHGDLSPRNQTKMQTKIHGDLSPRNQPSHKNSCKRLC
jgi:hypothetical protein